MALHRVFGVASLLTVTAALADEPSDGGPWAGRTVVLANVERLTGSYGTAGPCRLAMVVIAVDAQSSLPQAPTAKVGDRLDVGTNCYTTSLHQMQQPGTFRFELTRNKAGALEASVIGGRELLRRTGPGPAVSRQAPSPEAGAPSP